MPKYYNNSCEYVFKNGSKKGQICGKVCQENLCKTHKKTTLDKKKEYYNKNKKVDEGIYQHLIDRVKKHIKDNCNVNSCEYLIKRLKIIDELNYLEIKKNGFLIALNKCDENDLILNSQPMKKLLIKLYKHYSKYNKDEKKIKVIKTDKEKNLMREYEKIEEEYYSLNSHYEFTKKYQSDMLQEKSGKDLKEKLSFLKREKKKLEEQLKIDDEDKIIVEKMKDIKVTEEDLKNKELIDKCFKKYKKTNKYNDYKIKYLDGDDNKYFHKITNGLYRKCNKKITSEDLKNIQDKILHHKRLILTYNEIIKLFDD